MKNKTAAAIIIGLCVLSVIVGFINSLALAGKVGRHENNVNGFHGFFASGNKLALITLEGPIASDTSEGLLGETRSAESVRKSLKDAINDNTVKGVVLKIDSPGGTVGMSQEIYSTVLRLRKKKPVVVSMGDLAASGGYYISSAADRIFAEPGTLTCSIGVIMETLDAQQLLNQKLGIKANVIKSGKFKDIASPYRPMTPDERTLLQNLINTTYQQFLNAIIAGRIYRNDKYDVKASSLTVATLKQYADGRVMTGQQAQKLGFVDQLGGTYEAQRAAGKMAKLKFNLPTDKLPLVTYNRPAGLGELLFGAANSLFNKKDAASLIMPMSMKYSHQPLFIWE